MTLPEPTPADIEAWRRAAGHTQEQAGGLVGATRRTWQDWERGERPMPPGLALLYLLLTNQHPELRIRPR